VSLNGIIGYEVIVEESNNNSFLIEPSSLVTSDGNTTIGVLLSSLNGGKVYNITVRAYNLKRGDRGPVVSTNLTMKLGVPRPPKAVSAESNGPNSIDLHWSPSVSGGVTNYQITSVISNTENNRVPDYFVSHHVQLVNATTLKYTLRGLEPNTTYALWIKSMGLNTESEPSRVVFQKTETTLLSRCDTVNCILSEVKDTALDDFTIKLAEEIANATAWQLTNNAVTPEELQDAIYVVENLVSLQEQTLVQGMQFSSLDSYIDVFIQLCSIMLDLQQQKNWLVLDSSEGGPLFLSSLERYGRITAASYAFNNRTFSKTFTSHNSVLGISSVTDTESSLKSISFSSDSLISHPSSLSKENMTIPSSLLSKLLQKPNVSRVLVSDMLFNNLHEYMPSNTSNGTLPVGTQRNNSKEVPTTVLMSASIIEVIEGQPYSTNYKTRRLPGNITIVYSKIEV
jgi:hypothetical protein